MSIKELAERIELYPEQYTIEWANDRAHRADINSTELNEAIYVKAQVEQLGTPEGEFHVLAGNVYSPSEGYVGLPENANQPNVEVRQQLALHDWRLTSAYLTKSEENGKYLSNDDGFRIFGRMMYGEVGRYQQVGDNLVARFADGRLVMAPDLGVVRARLEAANFKPSDHDEFEVEEWQPFTESIPQPGEVPVDLLAQGYSSRGFRVSMAWRKSQRYWQEQQQQWQAGEAQRAATAGAATALLTSVGAQDGGTRLMSAAVDEPNQGFSTEMFQVQRQPASGDPTRVFTAAELATAGVRSEAGAATAFEAATTAMRVAAEVAREIRGVLSLAPGGELPALDDRTAALVDALLSYAATEQNGDSPDARAASEALQLFRAVPQR